MARSYGAVFGVRLDPAVSAAIDRISAEQGIPRTEWARLVLSQALGLPMPQTIESLAKRIESLEKKLGSLAS
jgi:hypothetical protein